MRRSKLIFLIFSVIFVIILIIIAVDIASRTTFPGSKKPATEQIEDDSTRVGHDSVN